jgi:hypothetical protein
MCSCECYAAQENQITKKSGTLSWSPTRLAAGGDLVPLISATGLICSAHSVKHDEIACHGTLNAWANRSV